MIRNKRSRGMSPTETRILAVWSESLLSAWRNFAFLAIQNTSSEDCVNVTSLSLYNIAFTLNQRHGISSRLLRRCINVMCPLGRVIWSDIRTEGKVSSGYNYFKIPRNMSADRSKAIPLSQLFLLPRRLLPEDCFVRHCLLIFSSFMPR